MRELHSLRSFVSIVMMERQYHKPHSSMEDMEKVGGNILKSKRRGAHQGGSSSTQRQVCIMQQQS